MNPFTSLPASPGQLLAAALLMVSLLLNAPAHGDIYKWTNEAGVVQYTQAPPPSGIHAQIIQGAPPPAEPQANIRNEQQKLQKQLDTMEEQQTRRAEDDANKKQGEEIAEANRKNCIAAQNNLAKLQLGGNRRYLTPEGEVVRLTEDERQQRITDVEAQIKKYCSS